MNLSVRIAMPLAALKRRLEAVALGRSAGDDQGVSGALPSTSNLRRPIESLGFEPIRALPRGAT